MGDPVSALPDAAAGGAAQPSAPLVLAGPREGAGQALRSALALSLCTGRPFHLHGIRAGRERPGLLRTHVGSIAAAQAVSGAVVTGAELASTEVAFHPGPVRAGAYTFGVAGAGNCLLALQTVWPALLLADGPSEITLRGGTHTPHAPPFQFVQLAFAPLMDRLGGTSHLHLRRHGFHPMGGGGVDVRLTPAPGGRLQPFDLLERGPLQSAFATCLAAAVPRHVAQRELDALCQALGWAPSQCRVPPVRQNEGPGNALMATLAHAHVTEVITRVGEKGVSAETVAHAVARDVRALLTARAALGPHLAQQWLLPLSVAVWRSGVPASFSCTALTPAAQAHIAVIERFLPCRITAEPFDGGWRVQVVPTPEREAHEA